MANYIVGLTGGIGSGKTAASDFFAQQGITIVDADLVARQVVTPGSHCLAAISEHFGEAVLNPDGSLNRRALRQIVFADEQQKQWLNALLHPQIRQQIEHQLAAAQSVYVVLVAPLLLENKLDKLCQRILVVDIPESLQVERTTTRDQTDADQVENIMAAQLARQERLQRADDVVDNSGSQQYLQQQLEKLHRHYLQLAQQ